MNKSRKELSTIDFAKFIFAICVVYLHVPAFFSFSEKLSYFITLPCKIAVPFFFLSGGYFLFEKIKHCKTENEEKMVLRDYCKKLGGIWLSWSAVYFLCRVIDIVFNVGSQLLSVRIFFYYVRVLLQDFIFRGISEHLWYLPASIVGTIIVYLLRKTKSKVFTQSVIGVLLVLGFLGNTYSFLLPDGLQRVYTLVMSIILTTRNGVFWAPVFILIGSYISDKGIETFQNKKIFRALCIAVLGLVIEGIWIFIRAESLVYVDMMVFLIPIAAFMFIFLAHIDLGVKQEITRRMRDMSLSIYLIHPLVLWIMKKVAMFTGWKGLYEASGWYFLIVVSISLLYAYLVNMKTEKSC